MIKYKSKSCRLLQHSGLCLLLAGCGANIDLGKSIEGGNSADVASNNAVITPGVVPPVVPPSVIAPTGGLLSYLSAPSYEIGSDFISRTVSSPLGYNTATNTYTIDRKKEVGNYTTNIWAEKPTDAFKLLGSDGIWYSFNQSSQKLSLVVETPTSALGTIVSTNGQVIPGISFRLAAKENDLSGSFLRTWMNAAFNILGYLPGLFPPQSTNPTTTLTFVSDLYNMAVSDGAVRYQGVSTSSSLAQTINFCLVGCIVESFKLMNATYLPANSNGIGIIKLKDVQTGTTLADATWQRTQAVVAGGTGVPIILVTFPDSVVASNTLGDGKYKVYAINPTDGLVYHGWRQTSGTAEIINRQLNTTAFNAWWAAQRADALVGSTGALNDTGITQCSDYALGYSGNFTIGLNCSLAFDAENDPIPPRQDALHGRDAKAAAGSLIKVGGGEGGFDFTKLDNAGNALPASATTWACVRDNNTKLVWENKTTDGGLRDWNKTYTWYSSDSTTNGGVAGTNTTANNTQAYAAAVNATNLCGASDWRLPDQQELRSIVHYGRVSPSIDVAYFPNTQSNYFWSSSVSAGFPLNAWNVKFDYGYGNGDVYGKNGSNYVRLVRSRQ
jgi:hypothetical protein